MARVRGYAQYNKHTQTHTNTRTSGPNGRLDPFTYGHNNGRHSSTATLDARIRRFYSILLSFVDSLGIQRLHCLTQRSDENLTDESLV